jgi:hypothetical protein
MPVQPIEALAANLNQSSQSGTGRKESKMQKVDRNKLEKAICRAIAVFGDADVHDIPHAGVVDAINAELTLGVSRVPGKVAPRDLNGYICALLALKAIPRATLEFSTRSRAPAVTRSVCRDRETPAGRAVLSEVGTHTTVGSTFRPAYAKRKGGS